MSSQIFKYKLPLELLVELLDKISYNSTPLATTPEDHPFTSGYESSLQTSKHYTIDNNSYKKGIFNESIVSFIEKCKPYYHVSKYVYLDRKMSFNNFITILRQICKYNNIVYTSKIIYDKSKYNIIYYIYI